MKTFYRYTILLTILLVATLARAEQPKKKHWYQVFLQQGEKQESIIGTSTLSPEEFSHTISGTELVHLDDIRLSNGTLGWTPPDEYLAKPQIFINPRFVIYFLEWAADPIPKDSKPK